MSRKLIITKEAEADILDGYLSYEEKQEGLGLRFMDEIELAVETDIRRAVTHTFPYLVFYTLDKQTVQILAVIHGSQDPAYINERLGA